MRTRIFRRLATAAVAVMLCGILAGCGNLNLKDTKSQTISDASGAKSEAISDAEHLQGGTEDKQIFDAEGKTEETQIAGTEGKTEERQSSGTEGGSEEKQVSGTEGGSEEKQASGTEGGTEERQASDTEVSGTEASGEGDGSDDNKVIIVLDPGHGGKEYGAKFYDRLEKNLTLKLGLLVRDYLVENYENVEVYLTRETDIVLHKDIKEDLELRAVVAEEKNANALVSLHFNASQKHGRYGTEIFISKKNTVNQECKGLAKSILKELHALGLDDDGVKTRDSNDMFDENGEPIDYYAINRHCAARDIPGIIVEHCFMDNPRDCEYIDSDEDLAIMARADAVGIANYYGLISKK